MIYYIHLTGGILHFKKKKKIKTKNKSKNVMFNYEMLVDLSDHILIKLSQS